jgi:hypothetical protein
MTPIEQWLEQYKDKLAIGYNIEPELIAKWPFFIVDYIRSPLHKAPGKLPNATISKLGAKLQKEVYKIRKESTKPDLYALLKPCNADHYLFIIATSTRDELDILAKGFATSTAFKVLF